MRKLISLVCLAWIGPAFAQAEIFGIRCEDYWDELRVGGIQHRFMDEIELEDLDIDFVNDLLDPAGEQPGVEHGKISMAVTIGSCRYSRTGPQLVSCREEYPINGQISFRYLKSLGNQHHEMHQVTRSLVIKDLALDVVLKIATDEKGNRVEQPVLELAFTANVADGRTLRYRHERPFGTMRPDNAGDVNWGRHCSFVVP